MTTIRSACGTHGFVVGLLLVTLAGLGASPLAEAGGCPNCPPGMIRVPDGYFRMGDSFDEGCEEERPVHTVHVSAFYMDVHEVTKALWDWVAQWALDNGYDIAPEHGLGKAPDHPVHSISWYQAVKWANARSEMEGLTPCYYTDETWTHVYRQGDLDVRTDWVEWNADGYRLPTEAEWEKAARGGCVGARFPWCEDDTIDHIRANYESSSYRLVCATGGMAPSAFFDVSVTRDYHPEYAVDPIPYTSPVGSFAPNDYGLFDMAGNVWEWCWDWYDTEYYARSPREDPRGPDSGVTRVTRGGSWRSISDGCRVANRGGFWPGDGDDFLGLRLVRVFQGSLP